MKRLIQYTVLMVLCVVACTSCKRTILEHPTNGGVDPTANLTLNLTLAIDPTVEPYVSTQQLSKAEDQETHDVRWIIEIFQDEINGEPVATRTISNSPDPAGNHQIETSFTLNVAKYHVVAWMDYVDQGSTDDKYYTINSLASICILDAENYIGDEEHKDAYTGTQEIDLSGYPTTSNESINYTMTLERPMAQIEFITTDLDKLTDPVQNQFYSANTFYADNIDPSELHISVEYAGYLPSSFNAYTNKPNDAQQGISFDCTATPLSDTEAHLASDHIFVNGSESAVTVNLAVKDAQGNVVNTINGINVPIVRGKLTTIRDEFLTKNFSSGIGIDPGFQGEFDIKIPD